MRYTRIWRNKFLTLEAKTLDEMVVGLQAATAELVEMHNTGKIVLDSGAEDDYATFVTEDSEMAKKYGFEEEE